jgi:hydrogenase nickel incorporation protein HypA/HybF
VHELSIADAVVDVAVRHAAGRRVLRVELRVGHLRQVVPSALTFAFELVAHGTPVEGAELVIVEVPAVGRCPACGVESELPGFPLACPACGRPDV